MNKTSEEVIFKLHNVIKHINIIIENDNFGAYIRIKESCLESEILITENKFKEACNEISFSIHIIMEAPPKNKEVGVKLLLELQTIYDSIKQLIH